MASRLGRPHHTACSAADKAYFTVLCATCGLLCSAFCATKGKGLKTAGQETWWGCGLSISRIRGAQQARHRATLTTETDRTGRRQRRDHAEREGCPVGGQP